MKLRLTKKKSRLLITGLFLAGWFMFLRPASLGGPLSTVLVTGVSMESTIHDGDLVVTQAQDHYEIGDVVAFDTGAAVVIHRIVGGSGDTGFTMKGDNNQGLDPWRPTTGDIIGKRWLRAPGLGIKVRQLQARPALLGALVGGLVAFAGFAPTARRRSVSTPDQASEV
jgi:signal peptidase